MTYEEVLVVREAARPVPNARLRMAHTTMRPMLSALRGGESSGGGLAGGELLAAAVLVLAAVLLLLVTGEEC